MIIKLFASNYAISMIFQSVFLLDTSIVTTTCYSSLYVVILTECCFKLEKVCYALPCLFESILDHLYNQSSYTLLLEVDIYSVICFHGATVNSNITQHIMYKMLKRTSFSIHPRCIWIDVQYLDNWTFKIISEVPSSRKSIKRIIRFKGKSRQFKPYF